MTKTPELNDSKLPLGTKLTYGFGSAAFGIKDAGLQIFLLMFYTQIIGVPAPVVGLALTVALVLDAVSDPIVGYWSDNFRSKWGRRHPFMYASAVPVAVFYFLLWTPPRNWDANGLFWYLLTMAVLTRTALTFFETPSAALGPELTRDYDERSTLQSWRSFFGWTGGNAMTVMMFFFLFPAFITPEIPNGQFNRDAYGVYAWVAAGVMFTAIIVSSLGTHGQIPKLTAPPQRKLTLAAVFREMIETLFNKSMGAIFLTAIIASTTLGMGQALSTYMSTYFWRLQPEQIGMITLVIFISAAIGAALAPVMTKRFGKKRGIIIIGTLGLITFPFAIAMRLTGMVTPGTDSAFWVVLVQGQVDVMLLVCQQVLLISMISDLVEQAEVKTGRRSEGVFFAANTFIMKVTTGIGLMAATVVLALAQFPSGVAPDQVPDSALVTLGWWYLPAIIVLRLAMILSILPYAVDRKSHEDNLRKLGAGPG
ncbi:MAG: sugar transporter [Rhodobacterales bacterium 12-64-8]|nr:MAG: sugar transporter [Rhodobacterales bacterium 12-64-8]OYX50766.1 MAG: sugar transporter [Alphaproteobacteria bacterium 32-64-14]